MHLDVIDLRQFYYRTRLGRIAQKAIRDQMLSFWPEAKGQTVVGFGFAVPLLRPYLADARRVVGLMPAEQGVMPWPSGLDNVSVLCREGLWPLETGHADKLVCLHGLETSEHPAAVLQECSRVLGPGGGRCSSCPTGAACGRGGTRRRSASGGPTRWGQLEAQLKRHDFVPERHCAALFSPPSDKRFWLKSADMLESLGSRLPGQRGGGVLIVEASKRVYAPLGPGLAERVKRPLKVLEGAPQPAGVTGRRPRAA
jgi:SAM-dependent methyltransferase